MHDREVRIVEGIHLYQGAVESFEGKAYGEIAENVAG